MVFCFICRIPSRFCVKENAAVILRDEGRGRCGMLHFYMVKELTTARYVIEWERLIMRLPSRYKELVTVCLYQKLKDEIADLDEKIMDNLFFFRISASDCNEHDTLFYLKSLDLDRRMGYELGTIYECTHEN